MVYILTLPKNSYYYKNNALILEILIFYIV